ncbi:uncharacterized protein LOC121392409 isoform X1 [Gigantopelta aegis]|uniref:uncharacterized protein LOC121392409 isoform X1 n=1 Tax=Gigantopelta aegis TaxID=1735272 RepID=UPI001B88D179|nr:uncharacterized protein LOC121392409 isoform X1 [Gigantopelta aegis]
MAGCKEIASVASQTGLTEEKVKVWIGNRRAKDRHAGVCGPKKVAYTYGPNAYSYFCGTIPRGDLSKQMYFKLCASEWKKLSEEDRAQFKIQAEKVRQDPNKGCDRKLLYKKHMSIINKSCDILQSSGFHVSGFSLDAENPDVPVLFGTQKGMKWLASKNAEIVTNILGDLFFISHLTTVLEIQSN